MVRRYAKRKEQRSVAVYDISNRALLPCRRSARRALSSNPSALCTDDPPPSGGDEPCSACLSVPLGRSPSRCQRQRRSCHFRATSARRRSRRTTVRQYISGSGVRGRRSCSSTASATPATCGRPWLQNSRETIPWWCPTCAAWASPRIPPTATTNARKRPTSGLSSPTWVSIGRPLSGTISAPWSPMPMPPAIPTRPRSWW